MKIEKQILLRILRHTIFWLVYLFGNTFIYGQAKNNYFFQFKMFTLYMPVVMIATYFTLYILLPKFLLKGKYISFAIFLLCSALVFSLGDRINTYYFIVPNYYPQYVGEFSIWSFNIFRDITNIYFTVFAALSIKLIIHWYQNQQKNQQLAQEKLEAELKFLKAQIHPHFLFNTLNNLYALTLKKSDVAPEVVLKLSELLNYMMYECNAKVVALEKEISLIKDYIALEQIRYGERLNVNFNVSGDVNNKQIAPMIILPFIENCFKHGVSQNIKNKWIKIDISINEHLLKLNIENSKNTQNSIDKAGYSEGIGLKNVKRRLNLLYPGKNKLNTLDKGNEYQVTLEIELIKNN